MTYVSAAVGVIGGILGFLGANDQAKAQMIIAKANADAANKVRAAENEFKGASTALQNYIRAEDNKKKFEAAGEQWNVINQNVVRIQDDYVKGDVQQKLRAAEEMGSVSAAASFMGIGGSTVDTINMLVERNYTDQKIDYEQKKTYQIQDMINERNSLMEQASNATDQGTTFANMDYNKNMPEYVAKPSPFTYLLNVFQNPAVQNSIRMGLGESHMNKLQKADFNASASSMAKSNYGSVKIK